MTTADIYGSIGVSLILIAYFLQIFKKLKAEDSAYLWLNFIGSSIACYASYLLKSVPFIVLEAVWAVVSVYGLWKRR
jgi:hypothetical protein